MKILILGGYGVFGGRLAKLLADLPSLEMLICGRSQTKAAVFCRDFQGIATVRPYRLDRIDLDGALTTERPDLVVDASGPFQTYNKTRRDCINACIKHRVNYLDFADAADFVFGVSKFDDAAKSAGIFVLSGASSFPALSGAVLREMAREMDIVEVEAGIAPSPLAGVSLNVMRAVVSYAGAPVKILRNGVNTTATGLGESRSFTVSVPGKVPLRHTRFSLVDVPDLQVIPASHPKVTEIWVGAGPVPEFLHRLLNGLAMTRATFNLPSLSPLTGIFYWVLNLLRFGEDRGGMYVLARGVHKDRRMELSWHLLVEGDDGPYIPSMVIEGIVRKILSADAPMPGARPATNVLALDDYERLFARHIISTGFRRGDEKDRPLYQRILGSAYAELPDQIQALHGQSNERQWQGQAQVQRGNGLLAKIICQIIGFPTSTAKIPVTVDLSPENGGERWVRNFGGRKFYSVQRAGSKRNAHLVLERFGVIEVALALVVEDNRLYLIPRQWTLFGLPLPKFLMPAGKSFESEVAGRFHFDVTISVPFIGLIVAYKGELTPAK